MAFCTDAWAKIKALIKSIGPKLGDITKQVTAITNALRSAEPTIELFLKLIPQGSEIAKWFAIGLSVLTGITVTVENLYEELVKWSNSFPTAVAKIKGLRNLAEVVSMSGDVASGNAQKKAKVYEAAVLARIVKDSPTITADDTDGPDLHITATNTEGVDLAAA